MFCSRSLILIILFTSSYSVSSARADSSTPLESSTSQKPSLLNRFHARSFSELMSPAFQKPEGRIGASVPNSDESAYVPTNLFDIFSLEFEVAPHVLLLYYQRTILIFSSDGTFQQWNLLVRDPRFALRLTQVIDIKNLNTTFDFYIHPGVSRNLLSTGNDYEFGLRTSSNYTPPGSRWTFGFIEEFSTAYLNPKGQGPRSYGWLMPWVIYTLTPRWSLQHFSTIPFTNSRNRAWNHFQWDGVPPFMQNGVGINFSPSVSASVLLNNYIGPRPTLKNTWASLWLSIEIL